MLSMNNIISDVLKNMIIDVTVVNSGLSNMMGAPNGFVRDEGFINTINNLLTYAKRVEDKAKAIQVPLNIIDKPIIWDEITSQEKYLIEICSKLGVKYDDIYSEGIECNRIKMLLEKINNFL